MDVIDKSVTLTKDVTDDVWQKLKELVVSLEDIKLTVKDVNVVLKVLDIPEAISVVTLENCTFKSYTELSGLQNGRYLGITNCSKNGLFSGLKLVDVVCRTFEFYEDKPKYKNIAHEKYLSLDIKNSVFHNLFYSSVDAPVFNKVVFIEKLVYSSHARHEEEQFFFNNCFFADFLNIEVNNVNRLSINMNKCQLISTQKDIVNSVSFSVDNVVISSLNITDSNLDGMNFNLFRREIEKIDIVNSQIKRLELYSVDDVDAPNRIYSISILDSHVDELLLNNRHIVHSLFFNRSKFNKPPQMFGANMPHGSYFPNKESFISRKGESDASCYRTLRYFMEIERNRELEGMFFTLEQESLLNKNDGIKKYLSINYLYYFFSNYGTDYIRPLLILVLSVILFTFTYSLMLSPKISPSLPIDWDIIENSFIFTIKQVLQPFSSLKDMTPLLDKNEPLEIKFVFIGVINSMLSITCLALSGLAVRWKFKRG